MKEARSHLIFQRTEVVSDLADKASLERDRAIEASIASIRSELYREADAAEARKRAGTFGFCEDCEGEISLVRLRAVPNATRCIGCQEKREEQKKSVFVPPFQSGGLRGSKLALL